METEWRMLGQREVFFLVGMSDFVEMPDAGALQALQWQYGMKGKNRKCSLVAHAGIKMSR